MKRFFIDFLIAFIVIICIFGLSGNSYNDMDYNEVILDNEEYVENIKDYDGNLINKISFKINNAVQKTADFGFELFKKALKSFLD